MAVLLKILVNAYQGMEGGSNNTVDGDQHNSFALHFSADIFYQLHFPKNDGIVVGDGLHFVKIRSAVDLCLPRNGVFVHDLAQRGTAFLEKFQMGVDRRLAVFISGGKMKPEAAGHLIGAFAVQYGHYLFFLSHCKAPFWWVIQLVFYHVH